MDSPTPFAKRSALAIWYEMSKEAPAYLDYPLEVVEMICNCLSFEELEPLKCLSPIWQTAAYKAQSSKTPLPLRNRLRVKTRLFKY